MPLVDYPDAAVHYDRLVISPRAANLMMSDLTESSEDVYSSGVGVFLSISLTVHINDVDFSEISSLY